MKELIDKAALVAEIERRIKETESMKPKFDQFWAGQISAFKGILKILDTLEVKEDVEYTRTDAFIKKAVKYIANHFLAPGMDNEINDFVNYMKGE